MREDGRRVGDKKEEENMRREELEGWKGVLIFWPCLEVTLHDTCRGVVSAHAAAGVLVIRKVMQTVGRQVVHASCASA